MNKKLYYLKITIIIVFSLVLIISLLLCWLHHSFQKSSENNSSFLVLSTGDCNGVKSILGIRTNQVIDKYSEKTIYPIENLDNGEYFNLKYPFQSANKVYYTTTNYRTGEECIVSKINTKPEWNDNSLSNSRYYRKQTNWEVIQKKTGKIKYKKVVGNSIYYLLESDIAEIWRFDMIENKDELLISNVHSDASFDIREDGAILYVNNSSFIIFRDIDGSERQLCQGTTACFWENSKVLLVNSSEVSIFSLTTGKTNKLCSATGNAIILSPSKTYFALYEESFYKNLEYDSIKIVDIATRRINEITNLPNSIYGVAWFDDYYPIS